MSKTDVADEVPPQNPSSPVEQSTCEPSRKSATRPFPRRLKLEGFPASPAPGSSRVPVTLENVGHLLDECGIEVGYDVIKKAVSVRRGSAILEETDLLSLGNLNGMGSNLLLDFVGTLARRKPVNPVADWINSKPWDNVDRLSDFYNTVAVQSGFPEAVRDFILFRWSLACVAAAMESDRFAGRGVLTFQGAQSIGKTRWLKRLVPEPMTNQWVKLDHHLDGNNKDSLFGAVTHWIVEIGELDSSFRKDVGRLKGVLTRDCDKLRLPYARSPIELPRRTVFAATVNEWNFLVDPTGNTRWWTIPVERLDHNHDIDMQQVFAQLAARYRAGEQWWLDDGETQVLNSLNSHHQAASVIEERIRERIDPDGKKPRSMTASKVLEEIGYRNPSNAQAKEAGAVLRSLYGPPKKIQGLMKWKVALLDPDTAVWQTKEEDDEY
jgi:putative DNA primase/helicase